MMSLMNLNLFQKYLKLKEMNILSPYIGGFTSRKRKITERK